jgi:hypothetical protein
MLIEEIKNIDSGKKELRKFGISVGGVLVIIAAILFYFDNLLYQYFGILGALLILFGLILPKLLFPFQKIWMTLAVILGFIMTRVILSILFYLIITPIGFVTRLIGKDFLDLKIEKEKKSYWNVRERKGYEKINTERQF